MSERRSVGSYDARHDGRTREPSDPRTPGKLVGCIRVGGAVRWSRPHAHDTTAEARECARDYMKNVDPEVGR